jgi:hypothetical protein
MSILRQIRRLRPLIDLEREYQIRRAAYGLLPVRHRSAHDVVAHACLWKTASQWVRLVLTDPRLYIHGGLKPIPYGRRMRFWRDGPPNIPSRSMLANLYLDFDRFQALVDGRAWAAIFVVRDPRDLLVSWYFSNRYSHVPNPVVLEMRAKMNGLNDRDGILATIDDFDEFATLIDSWTSAARHQPAIRIARFEDLTGTAALANWQDVLRHFDIQAPPETMAAVLRTYDVRKLRGSTKSSGEEVRSEKYRSGKPGDWQNYFDSEINDAFMRRYGGLVRETGYPASA